jgi:hypothetical protein
MCIQTNNDFIQQALALPQIEEPIKNYSKPKLIQIGDLRSLTFGPSVGCGESGDFWNLKTVGIDC